MNLKILLTNAPGFDLERFDITFNKGRGYSLYPPIALTTLAASVLEGVADSEVEILDDFNSKDSTYKIQILIFLLQIS